MQKLGQWFVGWLLSFRQPKLSMQTASVAAATVPIPRVLQVTSVSATIVGNTHLGMVPSKPNEDTCGVVLHEGKSAFYVVDGAGGESNGLLASIAVAKKLEEILPAALSAWSNEQEAHAGLYDVLVAANQAALDVKGMATIAIFVVFPSGAWALLQVGDAVFLGLDAAGKWNLLVMPKKFYPKRNMTPLLGGNADVSTLYPERISGAVPFAAFVITSDWVCGSSDNNFLCDAAPTGAFGVYVQNQKMLNWLKDRLMAQGILITAQELEAFLIAIRQGQVPEVAIPNDDMTLLYGVIQS